MKMKTTIVILALFVFAITANIMLAADEPYGPDGISVESNEQGNLSQIAAVQVNAAAGNVSQLSINASEITTHWQGYFGNITGTVTLDDAQGNTMFDWSAAIDYAPAGEIYAANSSITSWSDVMCVTLYGNNTSVNTSTLETMYGMDDSEGDGINETFTTTQDITIGTNLLSNCPATNTYVNNASDANYFNETLLVENSTKAVIFATQMEDDATGFDGRSWDFQMIVAESDAAGTTPYWFYLEIT